MSAATTDPCEFLPWDTEFFGHRIARVTANRLDADRAEAVRRWCETHTIECLYFLADLDDFETTHLAERQRFDLVDVRVTLRRSIDEKPVERTDSAAPIEVRPFLLSDIPALEEIARNSHGDSRFYFDRRFSRDRCAALYAAWIKKSCQGEADAVFVADRKEGPCGYITCRLSGAGQGQIGLFAVAAHARGQGAGRKLILESARWFAQQAAGSVAVVTQGRNIAAQRLYQSCGFFTHAVQLWYHWWQGEH